MKKTLTVALLGSIATTSVYADDLNSNIVKDSLTTYSTNVETAANTDTSSPIYAVKSIAEDAGNIQANGAKLAKGLVLTNNGKVKIPNAVKPKNMYMKDEASAELGLEKYRAERDEIQATIDRWETKKQGKGWLSKKNYDRKIAQKKLEKKAINTKIDILKGIASGDKAYAEEKIAQFNTIKNVTVKGPKAYFNDIAKPVSGHLTAAWDDATNLDYIQYRSDIDAFWADRVALWNGTYEASDNAIAFNDVTNYLTIQAIAAIQKNGSDNAVKLYADANTLAYTVTTLGDVESQVQAKIANRTALSSCNASIETIRANNTVKSARDVINGLSDEKAVETILTNLLDKINVGDIKVYDLNSLGNNWAIKAAVAAISTAIGKDGVIYVKDGNLMLRPASAVAGPVANAIANNGIYSQVADADRIIFGDDACNFEAAQKSDNPVVKAMVAATNQIAGELAEGGVIEPDFKANVYAALEATMFDKLNDVLPG